MFIFIINLSCSSTKDLFQRPLYSIDKYRIEDNIVIESLTCFLDEKTYKVLRYCKSLEIQYYNRAITIPQEGLEAIWNFLREYF